MHALCTIIGAFDLGLYSIAVITDAQSAVDDSETGIATATHAARPHPSSTSCIASPMTVQASRDKCAARPSQPTVHLRGPTIREAPRDRARPDVQTCPMHSESPVPTRPARLALALAAFTHAASAGAQTPAIRLVPIAEFGCADCEGPLLFSSIRAVDWMDHDRIVVLDGEAPFVRVFTPAGDVLAAFAREGSGPGELRTPTAAAAVGPDILEVLDMRLLRLTRFTMAGTVIETRTLPRDAFPLDARRVPGAWLVLTTDFRAPSPAVRRLEDGSTTAERVLAPPSDFPRDRHGELTIAASFAAAPDGSFALGEGAFAYRIRRHSPDGSLREVIERDILRPRRNADEMRREEDRRARMADRMRAMRAAEGGGPGSLPPVPEERNHFDIDALRYDRAGRLWVRTTRGGDDRTIFDVFDSAGRPLGEVAVDGVVGTFAFGAGVLVGALGGPDGIPRIGTWRVHG